LANFVEFGKGVNNKVEGKFGGLDWLLCGQWGHLKSDYRPTASFKSTHPVLIKFSESSLQISLTFYFTFPIFIEIS